MSLSNFLLIGVIFLTSTLALPQGLLGDWYLIPPIDGFEPVRPGLFQSLPPIIGTKLDGSILTATYINGTDTNMDLNTCIENIRGGLAFSSR